MPPRDPAFVQLDFPQLTSDLISQLRLTGTLGVLNFLPEVRPTFIIGSRGLSILQEEPVYAPAEIFDGLANNPAGTVTLVDTGELPAGDYDIICWMSLFETAGATNEAEMQHRNAGNTANIHRWFLITGAAADKVLEIKVSLRVAEDERFLVFINGPFTGRLGATLAVKRRVVP